jgi:hypothetical protein
MECQCRRFKCRLAALTALIGLLGAVFSVRADSTWVYAVQITATVQSSPPAITLHWSADPYGATSYTVSRKSKTDTAWGTGIALSGTATSYTDSSVVPGATYEYQIRKQSTVGYIGYGYIFTGIEAPFVEQRGKVILVVADNQVVALSNELARLESDLVGDGWQVVRHVTATNAAPSTVRSWIIADYNADPTNVKAVFLLGHVPVHRTGNLNYDTHGSRPMPADAYYADVNGNWSGSVNTLPSDLELMVGRVDFFNMPGLGSAAPWPSETELLRRYLDKDHRWRHGEVSVQRRALVGDRRGEEEGEATASSGYRNFEPFVGPGNILLADTEDDAALWDRWLPKLTADTYLWAYGCGGGMPAGISHLGTHGPYFEAWSTDVVDQDAKAVFVMLFGSWFGDWELSDNFMRAFLATSSVGLTCNISGRPHWFVHHMGLGEIIGYGARLSLNNTTVYRNHSNMLTRTIYGALMGDPTLRMEPIRPPVGLTAVNTAGGVVLNWLPSPDPVLGYHVYRSASPLGPFVRANTTLVNGTSFVDAAGGAFHYMVRAVRLETNPSGSYFNGSQGVFATVQTPIVLTATPGENGLVLSWSSDAGKTYRVFSRESWTEGAWADRSGTLSATGTNLTWTDTNLSAPTRFYRIATP